MIDYPPILQGSPYLQLQSLRDYLVRMAEEMQLIGQRADSTEQTVQKEMKTGLKKTESKSSDSTELRNLIVQTAGVIQSRIDEITTELHSDYLALSDFGSYAETVDSRITETAAGATEAYTKATAVESGFAGLESFKTELQGEIRRGVIEDPDTGEDVIGIAISQKVYLQSGGIPYVDLDGNVWDRLEQNQTLALYTSSGWQFRINGVKVGWFSSEDSSLHVSETVAERSLRICENWLLEDDGAGLGIRYNG